MPRELKTKEEFEKMLADAEGVRIVKSGDNAKVKLRMKVVLYTFRTTAEEADSLVKGTKVPIEEF